MTERVSVAIVGTRGVPNNYGGFEQFAQHLALGLAQRGYKVAVYNPHFHAFNGDEYCGATVVKRWCPERLMGSFAHYIYDYLCFRDAVANGTQFIVMCGYASSSPSLLFVRKRQAAVALNMDGMEWSRAKWGNLTSKFFRFAERVGVAKADYLIADNEGIAAYLRREYSADSIMIPYGATIPDIIDVGALGNFDLAEGEYYLVIARLEPENNIEMMLDGYLESGSDKSFCLVGNQGTRYGAYLQKRYRDARIRFLGGIYDMLVVNALRHCSALYFHGHSVGGTNPSLLDAMACGALICANDNVFNRSVLGVDGFYFSTAADIGHCIAHAAEHAELKSRLIENNLTKIRTTYSWDHIVDAYEDLFRDVAANQGNRGPGRATPQ